MNKALSFISLIVVAALAGYVGAKVSGAGPLSGVSEKQESVYDRAMRTGTLRCAYGTYQPEVIKDPNTGKLSGFVYDIVEEVGHQLNLKIEWTTELGFGWQNLPEDFRHGKFDAFCSGLIETASHARIGLFSTPVDYAPEYAFVRANDTRFDTTLDAINDPQVKIAAIDGESAALVAKEKFPLVSILSFATSNDISVVLESVATAKADVAITTIATAKGYMEHNPGKIKVIRNRPITAWTQPIMVVPHGEHDLKYAVDAAIRELSKNGFIERTFRKYDPNLESYLMVAKPYQTQARTAQ